jgi:hypothetical protein
MQKLLILALTLAISLPATVAQAAPQADGLRERVDALEASLTDALAEIAALKSRLAAVEGNSVLALDGALSLDPSTLTARFSGVNVQIVDGAGQTESLSGLGNLIVGYDEADPNGSDNKTGTHNLVVGSGNSYSSYGGTVLGRRNTISAPFANVVGGVANLASTGAATVSGGYQNTASGGASSVSGGVSNNASGEWSSVSGGGVNEAAGRLASVSGGQENKALGVRDSVSGGFFNTASGNASTVTGGENNTALGRGGSVSGGTNLTTPDVATSPWCAGFLAEDDCP